MMFINNLYRHCVLFFLLLISFSIKTYGQNLEDVSTWLKNNSGQDFSDEKEKSITPASNQFALKADDLTQKKSLVKPKASINDYGFAEEYEKATRINRIKLSKRINQYFQIDLINSKRNGNRHRAHIHALERKFVAKGKQGKSSYELLFSPDKSKAEYSYTF